MGRIIVPTTAKDGYIHGFSDVPNTIFDTVNDVYCGSTSSQDGIEYRSCFFFDTGHLLLPQTKIISASFKIHVTAKTGVNPTYYLIRAIKRFIGSQLDLSDWGYLGITTEGVSVYGGDIGTGNQVFPIPNPNTTINLSPTTNSGYTNLTMKCINGGDEGSIWSYIIMDAYERVGGTKAYLDIVYEDRVIITMP